MSTIVAQSRRSLVGSSRDAGSDDLVIVGGLGHVGLPIGLAFANAGLQVVLYDTSEQKAAVVRQGRMPFVEHGAEPILKAVLNKTLRLSASADSISRARLVMIAVGTPVDEYLNPKLRSILEVFTQINAHLRPEQTIIIRSTVYPGTCRQILNFLSADGHAWHVAYCPERIVQGYAIKELPELPQLVAGLSEKALKDAVELFGRVAPKVIPVSVEEAELAKLFANAWRYIQFAVSNQLFMIAQGFGVDFNRLRQVLMDGYGRAATLPMAGFAAGPCLLKDTLQLAAFNNNNFLLGHAAMMVNEGLPNFLVEDLRRRRDLSRTTVGILGMAFKADVDDIRDSLSYKLGKILRFHGAKVLYSDEFANDPTFISTERLLASSDVVIVGVPHSAYQQLVVSEGVEVVDLWGVIRRPKQNHAEHHLAEHPREASETLLRR
ncbi:MAG: nucleotide sugar dehydrogenase [Candidatus Omnitrophica bacterium]|nr:nucleotide sugar dehydrogenase [Candidatus Omnitrophota bacterium]